MFPKRVSQEELNAQIAAWNERYAVGTDVRSKLFPDRVHRTRTKALILFDHKAVIYLGGFNGYFDLAEISPADGDDTGLHAADGAVAMPAAQPTRAASAPATRTAAGKLRAVIFPGQGAQNKGMGAAVFGAFPEQTRRASEILGYSIEQLCLQDPDNRLNLTQYTQVALYVLNALTYLQHQQSATVPPDFLLGHSLGEYNALLAAGVFDFETGLRLVVKRGELMSAASGGSMAAVLQLSAQRIREVLAGHGLDAIDLANFNSPTQTVIGGPKDAMLRAEAVLSDANAVVVPLKVSAAFHSRYMREAQHRFSDFLQGFTFQPPQRTVLANASARPYEHGRVAQTLGEQIASPVLWADSIRYVLGQGEVEFSEIGGSILTRMIGEISAAYRGELASRSTAKSAP